MGGANHISSTQKAKLKIKHDFVIQVLDLILSTYIFKLNLWPSGLGTTWPIVNGLAQN
jgi:hypothetical protein